MTIIRDRALTREATAEGIAKNRIPENFWAAAMEALLQLCRERPYLSADDVWERLAQRWAPRGWLGAIMRQARREGIIELYRWDLSDRPITHGVPRRVWKSLLYKK